MRMLRMKCIGIAVLPLVIACTAGGMEDVDESQTALRSEDDGTLVYAGNYWQTGEVDFCDEEPGASLAEANGVHDVQYNLRVQCGDQTFSHSISMGPYSWLPTSEGLGLEPLVIASRDGLVGVSMQQWDQYHQAAAEAPQFIASLDDGSITLLSAPALTIGLDDITHLESSPLTGATGCWVGNVQGSIASYKEFGGENFSDCQVVGTIELASMNAVPGEGTLYIQPVD